MRKHFTIDPPKSWQFTDVKEKESVESHDRQCS